jgi:hypothetical protein
MKQIPPAPRGWNKTISDLFAEVAAGRRAAVGSPEADWARDYERSLLPEGTRFPCVGDTYEALEDFDAQYLTSWAAPYTGGGAATLPKGERVEVRHPAVISRPIMVYVYPVNYKELEARIVPEDVRNAGGYGGFYFAIRTVDLNTKFRIVRTAQGEIP